MLKHYLEKGGDRPVPNNSEVVAPVTTAPSPSATEAGPYCVEVSPYNDGWVVVGPNINRIVWASKEASQRVMILCNAVHAAGVAQGEAIATLTEIEEITP